jgi:hypothetical protein
VLAPAVSCPRGARVPGRLLCSVTKPPILAAELEKPVEKKHRNKLYLGAGTPPPPAGRSPRVHQRSKEMQWIRDAADSASATLIASGASGRGPAAASTGPSDAEHPAPVHSWTCQDCGIEGVAGTSDPAMCADKSGKWPFYWGCCNCARYVVHILFVILNTIMYIVTYHHHVGPSTGGSGTRKTAARTASSATRCSCPPAPSRLQALRARACGCQKWMLATGREAFGEGRRPEALR